MRPVQPRGQCDFKTLKLKHDHGMINRGLPFEEIISFIIGLDEFFRCAGVSLIAGVLDSLESFQSASRDGRLFLASALSKAVQEFIIILYSNSLFRMWWSGYSVRDYICRQVGSDGLNHQTKLQIVLIWDKIVWWATTEFRRSRLYVLVRPSWTFKFAFRAALQPDMTQCPQAACWSADWY